MMRSKPVLVAQAATPASADAKVDDSPEAKMNRRFPQKIRVGDLVGVPVIARDKHTVGKVDLVVRTSAGKIVLVVSTSRWFGLRKRSVAVPIEVVGSLGRQVALLDMTPDEFAAASPWSAGPESRIADDEIIRIALTKSF